MHVMFNNLFVQVVLIVSLRIFAQMAQKCFFPWLETVTSQWEVQSLILFLKALSALTKNANEQN